MTRSFYITFDLRTQNEINIGQIRRPGNMSVFDSEIKEKGYNLIQA
jgi:hypothetical protein